MTNFELAQQQGNQAAPNLLAAAAAGELGGGSSMFPSLNTAGFVTAILDFRLDTDQADEAAANTIYNNCKLVTDNHLDFFELEEAYLPEGSELSSLVSTYYAFSARLLARIKNLVVLAPEAELFEIFDNIEPDELCTFEDDIASEMETLVWDIASVGVDELPAEASGQITLAFSSDQDDVTNLLVPDGSSVYALYALLVIPGRDSLAYDALMSVQYYAESLLDTPVKLDKTISFYPARVAGV